MFQPLCLLLLAALSWLAAEGDVVIDRGMYHRDGEYDFELWIPKGFGIRKPDKGEIGYFSGDAGGGYAIVLAVGDWSSIQQFVRRRKASALDLFPGCEIEAHEGLEAGGRAAALVWYRKLDKTEEWKADELIVAAAELRGGEVLEIKIHLEKGRGKKALAEARSLLAGFKWSGERGLDLFLGARVLDINSGLSYRLPRDFEPEQGEGLVVAARKPEGVSRLTISRAVEPEVDRALHGAGPHRQRRGHSWKFPAAEGAEARGAIYGADAEGGIERVQVLVAVRPPNGPVFLLSAVGPASCEEALTRTAELVGLGFTYTDVPAAREEAMHAASTLAAAVRHQHAAAAEKAIAVLARCSFLAAARSALGAALDELRDPEALAAAAVALGESGAADAFDALLRAARNARNRKHVKLMAVLMAALGQVQDARAIPLLLSNVGQGDVEVQAAAIRGLGLYRAHDVKVLKPLVQVMAREETASRKPDLAARERWQLLKPAYVEALRNLTGQVFGSAGEADAWLRGRR
ncbi:MAG: HEAT repeat domain-containing protein [Planctomycetes bacterium]|nr:HEAT repeat domain-containing protein [Planctomycetota bacterium]